MNYKGKLYGHMGGRKYFELKMDSEDVDKLERERNELRGAIISILSACEGEGWTLDELRACCASHCRSVTTNQKLIKN